MQNIPTRIELGKRLRKVFKPKEGYIFIDADYSEYETFLKELMALHSELHAFIYQEHLNGLIEAAEELKANLNKLFDDMPA